MARPNLPVLPSKALVASATRLTSAQRKQRIYHAGQDWQRECYRHYSICGEARFGATLFAHAMSRSLLSIARETKEGQEPVAGKGEDLLDELFNGKTGQAQMLYALGLHLTIAGEAYLVGRKQDGVELWEIIAVTEMDVSGDKWAIKFGEGKNERIPLLDSDVVIRIWRPHPANRMQADSPFRSLLPTLNEIEWLTKHIFAQVSSRLSNDIMFLPSEMSFPPPPDVDGKPQQTANEADAFLKMYAAAMMEAIKGDGSPEDRFPIVVTADGEDIGNVQVLKMWSDLDENALIMRTEAIRRFALGMDIPPEQVLGVSGVGFGGEGGGANHWQGWQVEESTIKLHIEPMLDLICNALTLYYLRPLLPSGSKEYIAYSTINLRLRPDRSREAFELYDRGELTPEALRRENGFEETDAPTDEQRKAFLVNKIAGGSATPEMVNAALKLIGVELELPEKEEEVNRESRPDPSLTEHPDRPRTPQEQMPKAEPRANETESALLAACDALVLNALDRVGRRLLNARTRERGGPAKTQIPFITAHAELQVNGESAELLKGAFDYAPQVLGEICDCQDMVGTLENYCLALFATKTPHSRAALSEYLSRIGVITAAVQPPSQPALPPMTFNVHLPDSPTTVTLPENLVNLSVEAAKAPDVHVDVAAPQVNIPAEMTFKGLDLPETVINVPPAQVEVQAAAAPQAPEVTVNVEPTPVTVTNKVISPEPKVTVNNNVEPTPVNIENTVEAPKPRRRRSKVIRDDDGQVEAIETSE